MNDNTLPSTNSLVHAVETEMAVLIDHLAVPGAEAMSEMVRYHLGWTEQLPSGTGKRLRPLLLLLVCSAAAGDWPRAVPAAAAIELVHNFSLIHDDIEDGSDTRRGRPTVWRQWSLPQAINTGDAVLILSLAAALRLTALGVPEPAVLDVLDKLQKACLQLTIGQHMDLSFERAETATTSEYLKMIEGKTASLIAASTEIGALLAGAAPDQVAAFRAFGYHLGMAFQIEDDILGIWGAPDETGKSAFDDLAARKKTLPVIHGLAHSDDFAVQWRDQADGAANAGILRTSLETAGSLAYARELSKEHTQKALDQLNSAHPSSPAAERLGNLSHSLLGREA